MDEYETISSLSKKLGVSEMTVRRMLNDGSLQAFKIRNQVRIPCVAVEQYLISHTYHHQEGNE
jgi:excisionase family DNA binding protein